MRVGIHSATRYQTKDESLFDLDDYMICKEFLAPKDKEIARRCASIISALPVAGFDGVRILDVGTGEGSQVERVCCELGLLLRKTFRLPPSVILDCVEPCPIAGRYLNEVGTRLLSVGHEFCVHPEAVEDFLGKTRQEYAVVLACHLLYHFLPSSWLPLLERLMQAVTANGVLLVNLVSRESEIYRILERLESEGRLQGISRTVESCGYLCFSEDLETALKSLDCVCERQRISSTITIPEPDLYKLHANLESDVGEVSRVVRFFAFMFRVTPADLLAVGGHVFRDLLGRGVKTLKFESIDYLYSLRRRP